eukprot:CAMPEP_0181339980 /NCGR_PEP_ID=MMETSP1101-20121128/29582_1 /TAXON_ID=46948 /ORGANISM="Rhodomonas abbreviata, Strain Caron Lab Isolate" /LENGTH=84 /DNA_ID=CAMNT_0023451059 /DNA_START=151 /DNA_END=403 /DNA_ORIENTATION=+
MADLHIRKAGALRPRMRVLCVSEEEAHGMGVASMSADFIASTSFRSLLQGDNTQPQGTARPQPPKLTGTETLLREAPPALPPLQ